jgi:hypothetical protein
MHTAAVTLLQWQDTKLHPHGGCCPAAVAGAQTASLSIGRANIQQQQQQQQQQRKMYTRGALQAIAGKTAGKEFANQPA